MLGKLDARERQLTGIQRYAFADSYQRMMLVLVIITLGLGAFEVVATAAQLANRNVDFSSSIDDWFNVVAPAVGLLVCIFTAVIALVPLRLARRRLERSHAADPPRLAGSSGSCHVCGGPLGQPSARNSAVVRCAFCAADNIVAASVMQRVARSRQMVLDDYGRAVHVRRKWIEAFTIVYGIGMLWVLPPVTLLSHFGFIRLARALEHVVTDELPAQADLRYVLVLGCVHETDGKGHVRNADGVWRDEAAAKPGVGFGVNRLVGQLVYVSGSSHPIGPSVARVYRRSGAAGNWALVRNRSGDQARVPVLKLCVTVPPQDVPNFK